MIADNETRPGYENKPRVRPFVGAWWRVLVHEGWRELRPTKDHECVLCLVKILSGVRAFRREFGSSIPGAKRHNYEYVCTDCMDAANKHASERFDSTKNYWAGRVFGVAALPVADRVVGTPYVDGAAHRSAAVNSGVCVSGFAVPPAGMSAAPAISGVICPMFPPEPCAQTAQVQRPAPSLAAFDWILIIGAALSIVCAVAFALS